MTTNKIMALADAYADAGEHCWGPQRCALENAIARIIAERDTLAAGVRFVYVSSPKWSKWDLDAQLKSALEVANRLAAEESGGTPPQLAKPPAVPDATVEPEYDDEPPPRAPGHVCGPEGNCDCECMNRAAVELAKPAFSVRLSEMQEEVGGVLKHGGMSHTAELIAAIHAVACVVEELATEAKR
jgi:hypothetical protein